MLFSRIISCLAFVSVGMLAAAKPLWPQNVGELERRADPEEIVSGLKSKADNIIPHLKSAASKEVVSVDEIKIYFVELVAAFDDCKGSLDHGLRPEAKDYIVSEFTIIIKRVVDTCNAFPEGIFGLDELIYELDVAIFGVIEILDSILVGVAILIGGLLHEAGDLLKGLGFVLTCGLLGL